MILKPIEKLLLVEDNAGDARLFREMVNEQVGNRIQMIHKEQLSDAEAHLLEHKVDVILLDLGLPDAQGLEGIERIRALAPHIPLIVLTGLDDEELAGRALHGGAQDYLVKGDIDARGLFRAMRHAKQRKGLEGELLVEKERAEVTLNCIGDAIACTDAAGNITFINRAAEAMVGWSLQELLGRSIGEAFPIVRELPQDIAGSGDNQEYGINAGHDRVLMHRHGTALPVEDSSSAIYDQRGIPSGAVVVIRDVSATRKMARQMVHSAQHDYLTDLPNRLLLNDRVGQAIAAATRNSRRVGLLFLDMDGFKHVNDSLGHTVGDKLLQSIAIRLSENVRSSDTVSRQGGDEFLVLLPDVIDPFDMSHIAKKLLDAVAESYQVDQHELHMTTSIGMSVYPEDGLDAETLIKNADTAMYQAKATARNSFQFFTRQMNTLAVERQVLEEALRRALDRDEFALYYQPKVNIRTGEITGAEALIRWQHPTRGMVSPALFIPLAEECGLIVPIGRWVLRTACRQACEWISQGLPAMRVAVNVSASEFRQDSFLEDIASVLEEFGLPPHLLELELTEGVLIKHSDSTKAILESLRALGVQVALDDFGTGFSSLSYLTRFPIDTLKIDQSFVRQITKSTGDAPIVNAVIGIGKSLRLKIIAEGVETQEELTFLRELHCDEAQGYLFSRPVPPEQFAELLKRDLPFSAYNNGTSSQAFGTLGASYTGVDVVEGKGMVGREGFEPPTSCL